MDRWRKEAKRQRKQPEIAGSAVNSKKQIPHPHPQTARLGSG